MDSPRNVVVESDEPQGGGEYGAPKGVGAGAGAGAYANPGVGAGAGAGAGAYANPGVGPAAYAIPNPGVGSGTGGGRVALDLTWLVGFILRCIAIVTTFIGTVAFGAARADIFTQYQYFIAVNAIAIVYSAASLGIWIFKRHSPDDILMLVLKIADVVFLALLFSCNGTAAALGVPLGSIVGGIVMSMFGAIAYLALVIIAVIRSHFNNTTASSTIKQQH